MVKRIVGVLVVSVVMSCSGATAPPVFDGGSPVDAPPVLDGTTPIDARPVLDGASVVDAQLPPGPGAVGAMCNANSDCNSMLCLSNRRCSRTCAGQADCISGWTCAPLPGVGNLCQCTIGAEVCDGQDNDCNGLIDDGASCSGNRVCQAGACACPAERRTCGSDCVDPSNDAANCGACGTACGTGGSCVAGACTCPGSMGRACGGACRDLSNDAANCGACGTACGTGGSCVAGACTCPGSMGRACGGVCRDLSNDAANCGACGQLCRAPANATAATCAAGACRFTCNPNFADCDGNPANGCEVDTRSNVTNCGACGSACSARPNATVACAAGVCVVGACAAPFGDCDGNPANGCEANALTSVASCGGCGQVCLPPPNAAPACVGGACYVASCAAGFGDCDAYAANGCEVNTQSDLAHCGACGRPCARRPNAATRCAAGACGFTCDPNFADCDGNLANGCETDTRTSLAHCGACGRACSAGQRCSMGVCVL